MIQCNVNNLTGGIIDKEILLENLKVNCVPKDFVKIDVKKN